MVLFYVIIRAILDIEFCGDAPGCIPCPKYGRCSGSELFCEWPTERVGTGCVEMNTLPYFTQQIILEAEVYLAKRAFFDEEYSITETDLLEQLDVDHIVFYQFVELVKQGHSRLMTWRKDSKRWIEVDKDIGWYIGLLYYADQYLWVLGLVFVIAGFYVLGKKYFAKVKVD